MAYEENYRVLGIAVVTEVVEDYKSALREGNKYKIDALERWLNSDWCYLLSGMDGDYIIENVRKVVKDEEKDRGHDSKGTSKVYKKINKESKYKIKEYRKKKESIKGGE